MEILAKARFKPEFTVNAAPLQANQTTQEVFVIKHCEFVVDKENVGVAFLGTEDVIQYVFEYFSQTRWISGKRIY